MSVASVHRIVNLHDTLSSSYNYHEPAVLSIEELRTNLYSCFTCGVCWLQDHVCLDCAECGGYSLQRPCPDCDGRCGAQWKRDLTLSHACGKARWTGACLQALNSQMPSEEQRVCTNLNKMSLNS